MASGKIQSVLAQMQKNLECSICLEMMQNPISTACGHQFCRFCIMEFLERKKQVPCPLCKKAVTKRGLVKREQLGEMVKNVQKLIEAYQADTGTIFSPPRGASMDMLPSTPESIKPKSTSKRKSNVRRSVRSDSTQLRTPDGVEKQQVTTTHDNKMKEQTETCNTKVQTHAFKSTANHSDFRRKQSPAKIAENVNVQQLLDVIETGSHGAYNSHTSMETDLDSTINYSNEVNAKVNNSDSVENHKGFDKYEVNSRVCTDGKHKSNLDSCESSKLMPDDVEKDMCNTEIHENNDCDSSHSTAAEHVGNNHTTQVDVSQSGLSADSQTSSKGIVSLFRTPIDVKQLNSKKSTEDKKPQLTLRSLRSKKEVSNENIDEGSDVLLLTPDDKTNTELFNEKPKNIKTYSRKCSMDKDFKTRKKVSEWLKHLPNDEDEKTKSVNEQEENKDTTEDVNNIKKFKKKLTAAQKKSDLMGKRMKTFAGKVSKDSNGSLFGFEGLGDVNDLDRHTDIDDDKVKIQMESQERKETEKAEEKQEIPCKISDQNTNDESKEVQMILPIPEHEETVKVTEVNVTADCRGDTQMKPVQRKRIFKSKSTDSNSIVKKISNDNVILSAKSDLNAVKESLDIQENEKIENTTDEIQLNAKEMSLKTDRLLKFKESPIGKNNKESLDPFEFNSSQKTPQKPKSKKSRPKKTSKAGHGSKVSLANNKHPLKDASLLREAGKTIKKEISKSKTYDIHVIDKTSNCITNPELKKLAAKLDQAEDYDLLTCTQDVLMQMPDNDTNETANEKKDPSQFKNGKKRVRFKEPLKSDYISPGKIDIKDYSKEKEMSKNMPKVMSKVPDSGEVKNMKKKKSLYKETCLNKPVTMETVKEKPSNETDSDDLSEDYRFHDDSSGTEDLDVNPDEDEFEQPDLEKQPTKVKVQLAKKQDAPCTKTARIYNSPGMSSVKDTPQILVGPRFKNMLHKQNDSVPKVVDIVAETPLLIGQISTVAETPMLYDEPVEVKTDLNNYNTIAEDMNENPVLLTNRNKVDNEVSPNNDRKNSKSKTTDDFCGKDDTQMPARSVSKHNTNEAKNDTETKEPELILTQPTCATDENKTISETGSVEEDLLNFDIGTLEETDGIVVDTIADAKSEDEIEMENINDEKQCDVYIATKVSKADLVPLVDTDETQTPCYFKEVIDDKDEFCEKFKSNESIDNTNFDNSKDYNAGSLACSQNSVSILDINYDRNVADDIKSCNKSNESKLTCSNNEIIKPLSGNNLQKKKKKKKRKCFMLEDQESVEIGSSENTSKENTPKRQKTEENEDEMIQETEMADSDVTTINEDILEQKKVNIELHDERNIKHNEDSGNDSQDDLVLISQGDLENETNNVKERHLSGILISQSTHSGHSKSPENIFCMDSEMPTVSFSPEEETQGDYDMTQTKSQKDGEVNTKPVLESFTQTTHISDTQRSTVQNLTPGSSDGKRKGDVKASRGFSKRARNSEENSRSSMGSPKTPKTSLNNSCETPKSQGLRSSNTTQQGKAVSPSICRILNTPKSVNIMKYKSPVASIKPILNYHTPSANKASSSPVSSATLRKISKYSPGVQRVTQLGSPAELGKKGQGSPVRNDVEVVEINEWNQTEVNADCSQYANRKKRSPKIRLQLGSQERSKLLEEVETTLPEHQINALNHDIRDKQAMIYSENPDESVIQESCNFDNSESVIDLLKSKRSKIDSDKGYNFTEINSAIDCQKEHNKSKGVLHQSMSQRNDELGPAKASETVTCESKVDDEPSSPDLCLDDSDDDSLKSNSQDKFPVLELQSKTKYHKDEVSVQKVRKQDKDVSAKFTLSPSLCLESVDEYRQSEDEESEAEVIEESDLEEEPSLDSTKPEVYLDDRKRLEFDMSEEEGTKPVVDDEDIRRVKRIKPKRAILSDSDSDTEDESHRLDCTSSSAFSSQSENLTTQEKDKLEKDLETMAAEMAQLRDQLKKKDKAEKYPNNHKNTVHVIDDDDDDDDDDEEKIETDDSDVEMEHELCLSPPPFSPDRLSQETSAEDNISQKTEEEDERIKESSPVRKPLQDIDVNIVKDTANKDDIKQETINGKNNLGFVATGLSSLQVMEVKRLASENDAKFYSKMNPSVSHVIVRPDKDDKRMCDRTLKFFQGVANKCWIVGYKWILDSRTAGYVLPEDPYEIQGDTTMGCLHHGPRKSRLSKEDLFNGVRFAFFGDNQYLNKESISELIQACGGVTVAMNELGQYGKDTLVICCTDVEEEASQHVRQAVTKSKEFLKRFGLKTLKRDWVMDSLTTYNLQPMKPYVISDLIE